MPIKGRLYIVATPIGNLEDITLRAIATLKMVDVIACEDTRTSRKLLDKLGVKTPTVSYHQHSTDQQIKSLLKQIESGKNMAVITDAGTPGIQDPAGKLVTEAVKLSIDIVPIPGASALTALLSVSGINTDAFYFLGFLPKKKGRQTLFKEIENIIVPIVIYESPSRIIKTLKDIQDFLGNKQIIIGRELTKQFEEIKRGSVMEMISYFSKHAPRGEFVLIIHEEL